MAWDNAWKISNKHLDAVWIFAKYRNANSQQWQNLIFSGQSSSSDPQISLFNIVGGNIFVNTRGLSNTQKSINQAKITLELLEPLVGFVNPSFKVFGIEMVYIPEGPFYLGDGSDISFFYTSKLENGQLTRVPAFVDDLGTEPVSFEFGISTSSTNPSLDYPRGVGGFYIMKSEATQKQFVDFLNCLTRPQQEGLLPNLTEGVKTKYPMTGTNAPVERNAIAYDTTTIDGQAIEFYLDLNNNGIPNETNDGQSIACNYVSFNQYLAFLGCLL